jgi:uncharacterized protein (TIGR02246 family)
MIKGILTAGAAAIAVAASPAGAAQPDLARGAIQTVMDASAAAWSAGDLPRFMTLYEDSPETLYIGGDRVVRGYAAIGAMYASRFGGGSAAAMGQLSLEILEFRQMDRDHAFVVGRFHLHREAASSGDATGLTSLLFKRTRNGWRIVADHS